MHGNPVNYVDPSGELAWGVAAVAFLVGCGVGGIREALHQMSQDECGGGFFDKLKRVDWGPVAQACGEYGLFGLGLVFAGGGFGSAIATGTIIGGLSYLLGTMAYNAHSGNEILNGITLSGLTWNMMLGALFAGGDLYARAVYFPTLASQPLVQQGAYYLGYGFGFSSAVNMFGLAGDDDPFESDLETWGYFSVGVANLASLRSSSAGTVLAIITNSLATILLEAADKDEKVALESVQ